jgi:hypothetical protein
MSDAGYFSIQNARGLRIPAREVAHFTAALPDTVRQDFAFQQAGQARPSCVAWRRWLGL